MDKIGHSKREAIIQALEKSLGVVTPACKKVGISRQTFYNWYETDKEFKDKVDDLKNYAHDFVKSKVYECISDKVPSIIMHYTKTQMGWTERSDINVSSDDRIKIEIMPFDEELKG
tara:strand:+ start:14641 stop:14988 length:348 start_codon:yes stop_codon:yes gene_type:complete